MDFIRSLLHSTMISQIRPLVYRWSYSRWPKYCLNASFIRLAIPKRRSMLQCPRETNTFEMLQLDQDLEPHWQFQTRCGMREMMNTDSKWNSSLRLTNSDFKHRDPVEKVLRIEGRICPMGWQLQYSEVMGRESRCVIR